MKTIPLATTAALQPVTAFLRSRNAPVARYLHMEKLAPGMIDRGDTLITKAQVYGFIKLAQDREGMPGIGYAFGRGFFGGELADATRRAVTLYDATRTFETLLRRLMAENRIWLEFEGDIAWLCNTALDGFESQRDACSQCGVMILTELVRLVAGKDWNPRQFRIESKPSNAHVGVEGLSDAEVSFHPTTTAVAFPAAWLSHPLLDRNCTGGTQPPHRVDVASLESLVKEHLLEGELLTLDAAGEALRAHPRRIRRSLHRQGLTYRHLIDRVRFELAEVLLQDPANSTTCISNTLRYANPSNFTRAFRRMTGMSPLEFRTRPLGHAE